VAGEGAGLAMGLVMLGRPTAEIKEEMLVYARETQHEKIIRGLSVGLAFLFYGRQEEADSTVKEMLADKVRFVFMVCTTLNRKYRIP
jgi:26S proteasome regulatory subunit N2